MSAVTDTIALIDILKRGGTATNPQLLRIADQFRLYAGPAFVAVDPENPTNEELAENILVMFRGYGQSVLRAEAEGTERTTLNGQVIAAGDTAVADL